MFKETGKLLAAFVLGAVATVVGTVIAFKLIPLTALGASDSWKIAAALAARHAAQCMQTPNVHPRQQQGHALTVLACLLQAHWGRYQLCGSL